MRLIRLLFNEIWQDKMLKISFLLFNTGYFAFHLFLLIVSCLDPSPFFFLGVSLRFVLIYFLFFLFFSYEYFSKTEAVGFSESASTVFLGKARLFFAQLSVLVLCVLPIFGIMALLNVIDVFVENYGFEYMAHTLIHIAINYLMLPLIAILIGGSVALKYKRLQAYGVLVFFSVLVSPVFEKLIEVIYNSSGKSFEISKLFFLFTPSTEWSPVAVYGYSLQPYRISVLLFWLFLGLMLTLWGLSKFQNIKPFKGASALCAVLCLICAVNSGMPDSDLILNTNRPDSAGDLGADLYYKHNNLSLPQEINSFKINGYELNLNFDRNLNAEVTVDLADGSLKEYGFTLYYRYKIKNVTDEKGNELNFIQKGDWVTVYYDGGEILKHITFVYSGYNPTFYSNSQGVFLPGYFAYYPIPGYKEVFTADSSSALHYCRTLLPESVDFSLKITGKKQFFTNLEQTGDCEYTGKTRGLTVLSGYYKEKQINGIRIIYPFYGFSENDLQNYASFLKDKGYKTAMCLPDANLLYYNECAEIGDCILLPDTFDLVEANYPLINVQPEKLPLYYAMLYYSEDQVRYNEELTKQKKYNGRAVIVRFDNAIAKLGEEKTLAVCYEYLYNDNDSREPADFFESVIN